jgi:hypothetical protein
MAVRPLRVFIAALAGEGENRKRSKLIDETIVSFLMIIK